MMWECQPRYVPMKSKQDCFDGHDGVAIDLVVTPDCKAGFDS